MVVPPKDRLTIDTPKCASCMHWVRMSDAFGECDNAKNVIHTNEATARHVRQHLWVTDLMLCSNWERREG